MDQSPTPSFQTLYHQYIDAFNAHSWEGVQACLSPNVEIYVRGKLALKDDWEKLKKDFMDHWALPNARVSIPQLEEFENGVVVKVLDHARNQIVDVTYTYALQEGKWLQVRHEVHEVTKVTAEQDDSADTRTGE